MRGWSSSGLESTWVIDGTIIARCFFDKQQGGSANYSMTFPLHSLSCMVNCGLRMIKSVKLLCRSKFVNR